MNNPYENQALRAGPTKNAVKTQIWIAASAYVLVAILCERLGDGGQPYQILQIFSVPLFEKTAILCAFQIIDEDADFADNVNQLIRFDF